MSAFVLKLLALLAMVTDHTAIVLLSISPLYMPMRSFGRMAFLVYAFFLAEGFRHTRSASKYALRLLGMGVVSTVPYCFTVNNYFDFWTRLRWLNIYFTLALGVLLMVLLRLDMWRGKRPSRLWGILPLVLIGPVFLQFASQQIAWIIGTLLLAAGLGLLIQPGVPWVPALTDWCWKTAVFLAGYQLLHEWTGLQVEYGFNALLLFAALWLCRNRWASAAVLAGLALWMYPPAYGILPTLGALLAPALVLFYNGQRGPDDHRLFYWAYPAHLSALWAISAWLGYPV